ncbi:MAG: tRNA (cytidine(34)-2'-O)-methyltransferase [Deltaproteobacteria bacterium]|jgi:tRNA (cytidine/uridine-2'-O-)-methyltransferase|nr:tRNA (cytidine(34)-2'-O)-methyltransferase [Deltaproteobacteria bacterium]
MDLILFEPEIPPNTGNIARLTAGLGLGLHLIQPLGFSLEDRYLRRAGLDYWPLVRLTVHPGWPDFLKSWTGGSLAGTSARQGEHFSLYEPEDNDGLVLGPETRGLPPEVLRDCRRVFTIPLAPGIRSLNLAACAGFMLGAAFSRKKPPPSVSLPG